MNLQAAPRGAERSRSVSGRGCAPLGIGAGGAAAVAPARRHGLGVGVGWVPRRWGELVVVRRLGVGVACVRQGGDRTGSGQGATGCDRIGVACGDASGGCAGSGVGWCLGVLSSSSGGRGRRWYGRVGVRKGELDAPYSSTSSSSSSSSSSLRPEPSSAGSSSAST